MRVSKERRSCIETLQSSSNLRKQMSKQNGQCHAILVEYNFSAYKFISNGDPKSQNEVQNTIVAAQKHPQLETHIT
jgi:hypothetical protein